MKGRILFGAIGLLLAGIHCGVAQSSLTYIDLVKRLTDLERLALLPVPGEQTAQWSSYDRKSRYDDASGKYVGWDANGDGHGIIRKEGEQQVLAEMQGPGCLWRIWSATPKQGHVRIYLDGASEPVVDLPFVGYFDGKNLPFTRPALVHTVAKGWNNYTPIPYQKSCKIVADPGWGDYFHFNYETFPAGTSVPTFHRQLSAAESAALDQANADLVRRGPREEAFRSKVSGREGQESAEATETIQLEGPAAITGLRIKLELPNGTSQHEVLRTATLQIRWDGEKDPAVWAPLGDFFGTAPGLNVYSSLPMGASEDGWWYSHWFMPFARSAEVTFKREGSTPLRMSYEIGTKQLSPAHVKKYGRFHAKWHRDAFLPAEAERWIDWPIVKTTGAGRFVGVMLHIWNPRGGWWGEGDEKFFVDGEKFPSTIGTGSEDYFGYAWCNPGLFQNAYHNQTHNDGNNRGHISVNRWHITDSVPFQRGFEGYIEKYYPNSRPTLYAATAYWYLAPDGKDPYPVVPTSERTAYFTNAPVLPHVKGAIEGEALKILSKTGGEPQEQDLTAFGDRWSGDAHLWWINAKPGDKLDLEIPVKAKGNYDLIGRFTKARDYGIMQLYLDGQKLGEPIDLYNPQVIPTGEMKLGRQQLSAGAHKLTIEIVGANPKADKSYMVGLDYLKLQP